MANARPKPRTSMLATRWLIASLLATAVAASGCSIGAGGDLPADDDDNDETQPDAGNGDDGTGGGDGEDDEWLVLLDERVVDYSSALRIAALRLTGELPTLAEIKFVADAGDQQLAYEALIDSYLDDTRFARQAFSFWQDTFKMGDTAELDSAPAFAAQLTVENRSYTELLTAQNDNCPSYDQEADGDGMFTAGECDNGVGIHAGLLTHPGVNKHFASNMAFRRVRWVQETFACTAYPAEVTTPQDVGGAALYTAPWPFDSIAGVQNGGEIDFLDASSVVCANCHATMNHLAPLFSYFDDDGMLQMEIAVTKPTEGLPFARFEDYLPTGQVTAWRLDVPAADLPALGQAMAADPLIAECAIARVWNFAFGKGDIVATLSLVPSEVIESQVADFTANGYRLKDAFRAVFTSDDFVKF